MSDIRSGNAQLDTYGRLTIGSTDEALEVVRGLNAEFINHGHTDGDRHPIKEEQFLRTDDDRTVIAGKTLTMEGTMKVPGAVNVTTGMITVGEFILEATSNGGVSIKFK